MKKFLLPLLFIIALASCTPKNIAYFQDRNPGLSEEVMVNSIPFKVRPGDRISIMVKSRNEQLTQQFNINGNNQNLTSASNNYGGYVVDDNGQIDFPVLGKIKVAGMNRQEITEHITNALRSSKLVDDAIVTVNYTGLYVYILGEGGGKKINIEKDKFTFWELLAESGDLSINAKRQNILVIREEDGLRTQYELDLTKMKNVYESPVYYVHQNDIVYIEPNNKTKRASTNNGNLFNTWGFWTGIIGTSVISIINIVK